MLTSLTQAWYQGHDVVAVLGQRHPALAAAALTSPLGDRTIALVD